MKEVAIDTVSRSAEIRGIGNDMVVIDVQAPAMKGEDNGRNGACREFAHSPVAEGIIVQEMQKDDVGNIDVPGEQPTHTSKQRVDFHDMHDLIPFPAVCENEKENIAVVGATNTATMNMNEKSENDVCDQQPLVDRLETGSGSTGYNNKFDIAIAAAASTCPIAGPSKRGQGSKRKRKAMDDSFTKKASNNEEKLYNCPHPGCKKKFAMASYLKQHMVCHSEARPFKCHHCDLAFARKYQLQVHIRGRHTNERPYTCSEPGCGKTFVTASAALDHTRRVHRSEPEFQCQHCDKRFFTPTSVRAHKCSKNKDSSDTNAGNQSIASVPSENAAILERNMDNNECGKKSRKKNVSKKRKPHSRKMSNRNNAKDNILQATNVNSMTATECNRGTNKNLITAPPKPKTLPPKKWFGSAASAENVGVRDSVFNPPSGQSFSSPNIPCEAPSTTLRDRGTNGMNIDRAAQIQYAIPTSSCPKAEYTVESSSREIDRNVLTMHQQQQMLAAANYVANLSHFQLQSSTPTVLPIVQNSMPIIAPLANIGLQYFNHNRLISTSADGSQAVLADPSKGRLMR